MFSKDRNNTCFVVEADKKYLIDCPRVLFNTFEKAKLKVADVDDLILTHVHGDHLGETEALIYYKWFAQDKRKLNIYTSEKVFGQAKLALAHVVNSLGGGELTDYVNFIDITPGKGYRGPIELDTIDNLHSVPTIGLKLRYGDKKFAYSSDTNFSPADINGLHASGLISEERKARLLNFLWDADMIIHEATGKNEPFATENKHTYIDNLERLPADIKGKLLIAHYPDGLETDLTLLKDYQLIKLQPRDDKSLKSFSIQIIGGE